MLHTVICMWPHPTECLGAMRSSRWTHRVSAPSALCELQLRRVQTQSHPCPGWKFRTTTSPMPLSWTFHFLTVRLSALGGSQTLRSAARRLRAVAVATRCPHLVNLVGCHRVPVLLDKPI